MQKLTCEKTKIAVEAERAFLDQMEGGCQVPIAGFAVAKKMVKVALTALVASPDGKVIYKEEVSGTNPIQVGQEAAKLISEKGGKKLIDSVKEELRSVMNTLPLKDYRILITRGKEQAERFKTIIEQYGGTPIIVPLLDFQLPDESDSRLKQTITNMSSYDWLILTSQNGVQFLFELV